MIPEGLPNYRIPLPIMYLPPCKAEPSCNMADGQQENEGEEEEISMGKYRITSTNDSEDYFTPDEIDGVEVLLVDKLMLKIFYHSYFFLSSCFIFLKSI